MTTSKVPIADSEKKFQALADCSPFGIFHTDTAGGAVYTNAAWQQMSGPSEQESLGDGWANAVHPDDRERVFSEWRATTAAGPDFDTRYRIRRSNGVVRHLQAKARALGPDAGRDGGYVGTALDITAQVEASGQLRDNNVLLQTMLAHIPCGISVFDRNLKLLVGNPLFRSMLELPDSLFEGGKADFRSLNLYTAKRLHPGNPEAEVERRLQAALHERADMRQGMVAGADDYITKPFTPQELSDAVAAALAKREIHDGRRKKVVTELLQDQKRRLTGLYERRLSRELQQRWPVNGDGSEQDERFDGAIALFADIVAYAALAEQLSPDELSEVVKRFYGGAGDTLYLFGARHLHFVGEGVLALFAEDNDTQSVGHGQRAMRAALGLHDTACALSRFLKQRYPGRDLPQFTVTVALHSGPVTLAKLRDPITGAAARILPVGETVGLAIRLQQQVAALGWVVLATQEVMDEIGDGVMTLGAASLDVPGRSKRVKVREVLAIKAP